MIISVGEKHEKYAKKVSSLLEKAEIRATLDNRNETVGKKIRESELNKTPYMGIVGDKEVKNNNPSRSAKLRFAIRSKNEFIYPKKLIEKFSKYLDLEAINV